MARGSGNIVKVRNAGHSAQARPLNLSLRPKSAALVLASDRREQWFASTLAGCGLAAGLGALALVTAQATNNAAATVPVHVELRPLSSPAPAMATDTAALPDAADAPPITGSLAPRHAAQPGASAAVERAAAMAAQAAIAGLGAGSHAVDKPTVIGQEAPPLRLASLAVPVNLTILTKRPPAAAREDSASHTIVVAEGDTLYDILESYGVAMTDAVAVARALAEVFEPQALRAGQELSLTVRTDEDGRTYPLSLVLLTNDSEVEITRDSDDRFVAHANSMADSDREYRRAMASIAGSLYRTARQQGVPDSVIVSMMRTHSYDVDFQREIHAGDLFEVFYASGSPDAQDERGQLLFSSLSTRGKTRSYYRFTSPDGTTDYYDATGTSSKKPLMKTPINGARISSGFGMRKHPILGYTKMHGGTDFAAPAGTPILAAGDGKVAFAGPNGGYGNYVKLEHKDGLETAYAHMSRLAKGIQRGKSVRQGDVIGYVGSTGRSTGPHLHYEVHIRGAKQNPLTVKVAGGGRKLEGKEFASFEAERKRIDALRAEAPLEALVAAAQP